MANLPYQNPTSETQWSMDLLARLGSPAKSSSDPRVIFLNKWQNVEANPPGSSTYASEHNPLSTSEPGPGSVPFNSSGIQAFPDASTGIDATIKTLQQGYDSPIYNALRDPTSSNAALGSALGASNWAGGGPGSSGNASYGAEVAGVPISALGGGVGGSSGQPPASGLAQGTTQTTPTSNLTGLAGVLQDIDGLLNPHGPGVGIAASIATLGVADIGSSVIGIVELLVFRAMFSAIFLGAAYLGVKMLTGGMTGPTVNILENVQAQRRLETTQATTAIREEARAQTYERREAAKTRTAQKTEAAKRATYRVQPQP